MILKTLNVNDMDKKDRIIQSYWRKIKIDEKTETEVNIERGSEIGYSKSILKLYLNLQIIFLVWASL